MTILDGTYSAFLVPISIAFSSDLNHWGWTTIIDTVAGKLQPRLPVLKPHVQEADAHAVAHRPPAHNLCDEYKISQFPAPCVALLCCLHCYIMPPLASHCDQ